MDVLGGIFPHVPTPVLQYIFQFCNRNVQHASHWLLENDWRSVQDRVNENPPTEEAAATPVTNTTSTGARTELNNATVVQSPIIHRSGDEFSNTVVEEQDEEDDEVDDEEDDEDEDEEDEDEDDEMIDIDLANESYLEERILPLAKRRRIEPTSSEKLNKKEERFWVSFDGMVLEKSLIEMLNTALSKLAHTNVILLNSKTQQLERTKATTLLKSVIQKDKSSPTTEDQKPSASSKSIKGYWAYFFSITELDMVWRSILHAHLFSARFGQTLELHAIMNGGAGLRGFDELMHLHTSTAERFAAASLTRRSDMFKCCLLLPCEGDEATIYNIGKHLMLTLKLKDSLFFRSTEVDPAGSTEPSPPAPIFTVDVAESGEVPGENSSLEVSSMPHDSSSSQSTTEAKAEATCVDATKPKSVQLNELHHRQHSLYRISRSEKKPTEANGAEKISILNVLPKKTVLFELSRLGSSGWTHCPVA